MRIVCWQTILMKYNAFLVIFEKAAKFESVVCCKLKVALYELSWSFPSQVMFGGFTELNQYEAVRMKWLSQGHNTVPAFRLKPGTSLSQIAHSTTEEWNV